MKINVLYVGDTQVNVSTSIKGIDSWTFTYYSDSAHYLRDALNAAPDINLVHIRANPYETCHQRLKSLKNTIV